MGGGSHLRRLAALTALIALAGFLLGGATASAQSPAPLASNTGLSIDILSSTSTPLFNQAQAFTTGSNTTGYTLTSVDLGIIQTTAPPPTFTVKVHAHSGGEGPGSVVATLTNPGSLHSYDPHDLNTPAVSEALSRFTSTSGIQLAADTTYWVVIVVSANNANGGLVARTDGNEDAGGAAGWSIADGSKFRNPTDPGPWLPATGLDSYVLYMNLNGSVRASGTPPAGGTPSADDTPPPCPPGTVRVDVETDPTGCQVTNASRFLDWQNRYADNLCNPGERIGYMGGGNGGPICAYDHEFVNCTSGNSEGLTGRRCVDLQAAANAAHREDGSPDPPYSSKYPPNYGLPGCLDVISFDGVWQCR
ncbi:MAG: hypothetical protein OXF01_16235 [Gemmatimonadetes bacterium]|nr:hypothetical protein [Gemmatimonadota bacterium]